MSNRFTSLFSKRESEPSTGALLVQAAVGVATVLALTGITRLGKNHVRKGTPQSAQKRMRELLEAKKARDRQGPNYPAANAHTGRHDEAAPADRGEVHQQNPLPRRPSPDAVYGATYDHARGDQGKRSQDR